MAIWSGNMNYSSATGDIPEEVTVKEYTTVDLWQEAWSKTGKSLFYMQFLRPEVDWGSQKIRIERMCFHLAAEWQSHYKDTKENREWFRKWIKMLEDETENQC